MQTHGAGLYAVLCKGAQGRSSIVTAGAQSRTPAGVWQPIASAGPHRPTRLLALGSFLNLQSSREHHSCWLWAVLCACRFPHTHTPTGAEQPRALAVPHIPTHLLAPGSLLHLQCLAYPRACWR